MVVDTKAFLPGFLDGVGQGLDVETIHTWNELTVANGTFLRSSIDAYVWRAS